MENNVKIDYDYLDSLFDDRRNAINFVTKNQEKFKDTKKAELKFSSYSDAYLGNETPSVFLKNDKRFLKKKPENRDYISYRYDDNGKILSVAHYSILKKDFEKCDCTYYFFDSNGYKYAVPFLGESFSFYPSYTFKYKYKNEKIHYVAYIDSSSLWLELYDWNKKQCTVLYYVPALVRSNKSVSVGTEKPPISVSIKSLDFSVKIFSESVYSEWFLSNMDKIDGDKNLYIVLNERFSSQYTVCFYSENNDIVSDELEFVFKKGWKSLFEKLVTLSKSITMNRKVFADLYIGFVDGDFEQL